MDINNVMLVIINMALSINGTVITIVAIAIGLVTIGSVLAPIATDVMDDLTENYGDQGASWASLVGVTVVISILGLIIVAVNGYTNGKK